MAMPWAILFHWGLPWTSPWPCHGIDKCLSDCQSHGPGYSMGPSLATTHGHAMALIWTFWLAIPWPKLFHGACIAPPTHTWPCHRFAWCFLNGNPNGPSSSIGAFLGQAHGHAMALPSALLIGHHLDQAIPWALSLATTHGHAMALIWTF